MLKRWIIFGSAIAAALIFSILWQNDDTGTTSRNIASEKVLGVEALMRNVDQYRSDLLLVEGVVSAADTDNQTLALIDVAEFQECGATNCAALTLPVRWPGPMPREQEMVRIKGEVQEVDSKLVFVAQTLRKMEPASRASQ